MIIKYLPDSITFESENMEEFNELYRMGRYFVSPREAINNHINNQWFITYPELKRFFETARKHELNEAITKNFDKFKVAVILATYGN